MPTDKQNVWGGLANERFLSKEQLATIKAFHYRLEHSPQFRQKLALQFYCFKITNQYWPIPHAELVREVVATPEDQLEQTIINFYSQKNYFRIQQIVSIWESCNFVVCRMPVLKSCLNVLLSNLPNEDKYNVLIPTLTAQLSGLKDLFYQYLENIPKGRKEEIKKELQKKLKNPKDKIGDNEILLQFLADEHILPELNLLELGQIIFKTTFARKERIKDLDTQKYNKFRNKILHGDPDFLDYGTEVNMIRAWLEVDFLIRVHNEIQKRLKQISK